MGPDEAYLRALERLQELRHFRGGPAEFWPDYLRCLVSVSAADEALIVFGEEHQRLTWRVLALEPRALASGSRVEQILEESAEGMHEAIRHGVARWRRNGAGCTAVRLVTGADRGPCLALFRLERERSLTEESERRLRLVADVPESYQLARVAAESKTQVEHFAAVLDLMALVNGERRFLPTAMTLCNELAARHRCERVSLGWLERGYVRVHAISHVDHFDRKTEAVQALEAVMEEALDQNTEIVVPPLPGGLASIRRDHQSYARSYDAGCLCSLPLRVEGKATAVCTLERSSPEFGEQELRLLRLTGDHVATRLADVKRRDRWFGARMATAARESLAKLLGYEHTGAKLIGLLVAAAVAATVFTRVPYRIKAPAILRTDEVAYLTAPFDGHLDSVAVRVGDHVEQGEQLLSLDQTDLLLREAELIAEKNRYLGELDRARATGALADLRITQARLDQVTARHDLVRHQLSQSAIKAPFSGVVVEGDLIERIGSPLRQGDTLFKLARIENLYAELEVDEADIHDVDAEFPGDIAFTSRPQDRYPIRVFRIEPVAVAKEEGNVFIVHADFAGPPQPWWRPGMTGVAKITAGERSLVWIATHRTIDFLRLRLWW
jgi:multidrug resistance efflux pump